VKVEAVLVADRSGFLRRQTVGNQSAAGKVGGQIASVTGVTGREKLRQAFPTTNFRPFRDGC
jgi:hypothetical protein